MSRSPLLPWLLGVAGLIPFAGLAGALLTGETLGWPAETVAGALAAYAATIASFLGGMRWGLAVAHSAPERVRGDYLLSVVPQLLAWAALGLPDRMRLVALGLLILVTGPLDLLLVRKGLAPPWFGRLRLVLSLGAGACLLAAAAAR